MPRTAANPQRPVLGYFAFWIDRLRAADALPSALADRLVRAAIHEAPPSCRPPSVEAWMFELATGHGDGIDCRRVVGWLRLRRALGCDAGLVDPETARYWHGRLGEPPRSSAPRWARRVRAVARDAGPLGFGLPPRLVAALCAHPAWARDYLRCATFKAWLAAADDPELAELPPPSPWPVPAGALAPFGAVGAPWADSGAARVEENPRRMPGIWPHERPGDPSRRTGYRLPGAPAGGRSSRAHHTPSG